MGNESKQGSDFCNERIFNLGMSAVGVAHDLNNFLCAIIAYADMALEESEGEPAITNNLNCILSVSEQARSTVREILNYTKNREASRKKVDLANVVGKVMTFIRSSVSTSLVLDFKSSCSSSIINGNENQIYQCIMNLAVNAAQAMNNCGTITFFLRSEYIDFECDGAIGPMLPGEYLVLDVTDTGPGIAPALLEKIFLPFFSTKASETGCGLGLAIIANIMTSHHGNIRMRSEVGTGTTFSLFLPVSTR